MSLRSRHYEIDMLNGSIMPKLLRFALPLILSSMLQLTFNAADVIVVGHYEGHHALAAVGAPGALINLLINLFLGLSVGANVVVAQCYGAGDYKGTSESVHTSMGLSVIGGIAVGIVGFAFAETFLKMMNTPAEVLPLATAYMKIYFLGMPANMIYNFGAAVLRAVGDTRRPLVYLTISGVVNVVFNLVFVIVFGWGVHGVAWSTIISQIISATLIVLCLMRSDGSIQLNLRKISFHKDKVWRISRVGLPAGLQGILFSISNVMVQSSVNAFGADVMAGNTAASNVENYIYVSMNAIYQAAITFIGQNVGAYKYERISKVTRASIASVMAIGIVLGGALMLNLHGFLGFFTTNEAAIAAGKIRSSIIAPTYFLCGMMDVMVGVLRGMGSSVVPMVVSIAGICIFRLVWILLIFPLNPTLQMLYISYPISWIVTFGIHTACYFHIKKSKFSL